MVVADDDVLMREGLARLLEDAGYEVVGQAGDGSQLLGLVREDQPDLAIGGIFAGSNVDGAGIAPASLT